MIQKALRDEGTSYHYQPPSEFSHADASLQRMIAAAISDLGVPIVAGATWTTDAPYRETEEAIAAMTAKGLLAVEMEAAALCAFAAARQKPVLCIAHVTNQMARVEGDFEKGEANGSLASLAIIRAAADGFLKVFDERSPLNIVLGVGAKGGSEGLSLACRDQVADRIRSLGRVQTFKLTYALLQGRDDGSDFGRCEARRDMLRAVPIERLDRDEKSSLDFRGIAGYCELRRQPRIILDRDGTRHA